MKADYPELALMIFDEGASIVPRDSTRLSTEYTLGRGLTLHTMGRLDEAEKCFTEVVENVADSSGLDMTAWLNLGILYRDRGEHSKSINAYRQAVRLATRDSNRRFIAAGYINIGEVEPDSKKALAALDTALAVSSDISDPTFICYCYYNIANRFHDSGNTTQARRYLEKARGLLDRLDNLDPVICKTYDLMSKIYGTDEIYSLAYHYQQRLLEANKQHERLRNNNLPETVDMTKQVITHVNGIGNNSGHSLWLAAVLVAIAAGVVTVVVVHRKTHGYPDENSLENIESLITRNKELMRHNNYLGVFYRDRDILLKHIRDEIKRGLEFPESERRRFFKSLSMGIAQSMNNENKDIDEESARVVSEFNEHLHTAGFDLTQGEAQLALYCHSGLSTRDISRLTGKLPRTVSQAKFRLKKSLGLQPDDDLETFLEEIACRQS